MSDVLILNEKIKSLAIKGLLDIKYADEIIRRLNLSVYHEYLENKLKKCYGDCEDNLLEFFIDITIKKMNEAGAFPCEKARLLTNEDVDKWDALKNKSMKKEHELECISKMLTISTAHISKKTADLLDFEGKNNVLQDIVVIPKDEYGWFIYPYPDDEKKLAVLPNDLRACIHFARKNGCSVLCLDRDYDEVAELPTYEW